MEQKLYRRSSRTHKIKEKIFLRNAAQKGSTSSSIKTTDEGYIFDANKHNEWIKSNYFNNILQKVDFMGCTQSTIEIKEYINHF